MNTSASVGLRFNIDTIDTSINTDVRFNIIKRREFITYKTLTDNDNTNLAYTINKPLISQNNITATDKANDLPANHLPEEDDVVIFTGKTINLFTDRFLATDQFFTSDSGQRIPIYYKHALSHFDSEDDDLTLADVILLDSTLHKTVNPVMIIDYDTGIIYNNLKNVFDYQSGDYTAYFVRYSVKNSASGQINSYVELINNVSVYRQATFDDLTSDGELPSDLKVYLIDDDLSSHTFEVTFPLLKTYAVLETAESRIHLKEPQNLGSTNQWFTTVTNGRFMTSLRTSALTSNIFGYNVPEFGAQLFDPFAPYKFKDSELSTRIDNHLIKTLKSHIQHDVDNEFHILVVARKDDGTVRVAASTDPSVIGTTLENVTVKNYIRSIDGLNGFIDLSVDILSSDKLEVSYYYEEVEYEILDIDFNPVFNLDIVGQRIVFYLVPNTSNTRTRCIFYLIVDWKGVITFCSQTDNTSLTADIATETFKYDVASPNGSNLNFIDKYTLQAVAAFQYTNPTNPKYLILSEVVTSDVKHSDESVIIDVRKPGGGIKNDPDLIEEIAQTVPEILWSTGIAPLGGYQYPGNASTLIEIPTYLQKDYGGSFNDIQLRSIVERHIAFGVYPILRGYSTNIVLAAVPNTDEDDNITIEASWRSYGAGKTYNVYISQFEDHGFVKDNAAPIADDPDGNVYTFSTDLEADKTYWVYAVVCDTIQNYPQTIIGTDINHTYELINKVEVQTYALP